MNNLVLDSFINHAWYGGIHLLSKSPLVKLRRYTHPTLAAQTCFTKFLSNDFSSFLKLGGMVV